MAAFSIAADPESRPAPGTAPLGGAPWLALVGIGEDGRAGLSPAAVALLDGAELIVGGVRHLALAAPLAGETLAWPSPLSQAYPAILARRGRPVCVLASGDPFHYGVGAELARLVPSEELVCLPQPSAFSLAAARMGWPLAECALVTLHGRALERIVPLLQPGGRVLALTWDGSTAARLAALLVERGCPASRLTVLEAMGGPREGRRSARADAFALGQIDPLNTVAIEVVAGPDARIVALAPGLPDALFESDGQLTKCEVRAVTLAALAPRAGETLWDVGAGSGSVGIEWCLRHPMNRTLAIEARPERAERIRRNARALGVPDLTLVQGRAPEVLAGLPPAQAAFLGGGLSQPGLIAAVREALPAGGRIVANAVTLEGEAALAAAYARFGGGMRRIAISRADPVGGLTGWRPLMAVTQWWAVKA